MLGKAETVNGASQIFTRINNNFKIYLKKNTSPSKMPEHVQHYSRNIDNTMQPVTVHPGIAQHTAETADLLDGALLKHYMPACAVINKEMEIVEFRGMASNFLTHYSGKANLNILKMARPEFTFELRHAITMVMKTKKTVRKEGIELEIGSDVRRMSIDVSLLSPELEDPLLLIVFNLYEKVKEFGQAGDSSKNETHQKDLRIKKLTEDLESTRAQMTSIIEIQEAMHNDLQAANEEIISTNEEFQTLNEELETSKEEIQASNEELLSTNHELQTRNDLLAESYEFSEAIIATCHEQMLVLNKDFRIKSANQSFYTKFNSKKEDIEGKLLFELSNNLWDIPKLRTLLSDVIQNGKGFENFEVSHVFPSGEKVMLLNANLIIQRTHSEQLILLAIDDVTERSRSLMREKKSLRLIEASLDPLVTIDNLGKITDMNLATVNITGQTREKLKNSYLFEHFTEPEMARSFFMEAFYKGAVTNTPLTLKHRTGKETPILLNATVYKDDFEKVLGVVIVARDITEQKKIADKLVEARIAADLATKNAEEARIKAENAERVAVNAMESKQQFLANMSHEIRTPLSAIIGFTKILSKTNLTSQQQEYLSAIKTSGDGLIVIVNDILDLAKVNSGKMTLEQKPFSLAESIRTMLTLFRPKTQEKNIELVSEYDDHIPNGLIGDPARLHQVIMNLLSNAVKFTNKGKITVSTRLVYESSKKVTVEFSISDTGIGIAKENIDRVFENFQQESTGTARLFGGTGLGLAIAKRFIELQNGSIKVSSEVGKGSVFSFELTFQKIKGEKNNEVVPPRPVVIAEKLKVLVVEDIPLNQLLIKLILRDFGFEPEIAENGKIAIDKLRKDEFDIVLMDLQMPEMNGFEATEYIRKTLHSKIPIIALTADVTAADKERFEQLGMNDYAAKPIDEESLYRKIIQAVRPA